MFAARIMLLVLSGIAKWHAAQARDRPEKNHSSRHKGKYGNWTCVCDFNETNTINRSLWKDREHWHNNTDVEHEGNQRWGKDDERWEAGKFNKTIATNRSTWKNWTAGKDEWDEDEADERWGNDDKLKRCMCGSVPGHWEFIGGRDSDNEHWGDDENEHESSHHKRWGEGGEKEYTSSHRDKKGSEQWDKDDEKHPCSHCDIGFVLGFSAGGILVGGIMVAVICLACQRKRAWVKAPPATCVIGRPTTGDVVVGATVEKGQVPTVHETSNPDAHVIADLERGVGNRSAI